MLPNQWADHVVNLSVRARLKRRGMIQRKLLGRTYDKYKRLIDGRRLDDLPVIGPIPRLEFPACSRAAVSDSEECEIVLCNHLLDNPQFGEHDRDIGKGRRGPKPLGVRQAGESDIFYEQELQPCEP